MWVVSLDVDAVESGEDAVGHAHFSECALDGTGVGLPARLLRTADDHVEPVADAEVVQHRSGEKVRTVGDETDRSVQFCDEAGVVVEIRRRRPGLGVLLVVEGSPELRGGDAPLAETVVASPAQAVPQDFGLVVREVVAEAVADPVEHVAGVAPLGVDEGAVEVEQPALVVVDADAAGSGHRRP